MRPFVGQTPLFPLQQVFSKPGVQVFAKLEWQQLSGSVKMRPAFYLLREAIRNGRWQPGMRLLDSTSGNTGISYAALASRLGIGLTLVMPEDVSPARKLLLRSLGAELRETPASLSSDEVFAYTQELYQQQPDHFCYLNQYDTPANQQAHYETTGPEIWAQTGGQVTHFSCGLGTTGSFTGTGRYLLEKNPAIQLVAQHPDVQEHQIEGWKHLKTSFVPKIYASELAHAHLEVSTSEALHWVREVALKEGLVISPSSGANLAGAIRLAASLSEGVVVTIFPDDYSKYELRLREVLEKA